MELANLLQKYEVKKVRQPNSQRSYWIQCCSDLTGIPFKKIMWKFNHLVGPEGTEIIRQVYETALQASTDRTARCVKLWTELKKTKP